ncbi:MAG: helix-turn-helix transcriptional regulator, partial [Spirochaetes bacterium]|nr:helix-turn-helix transcriptional regulator [Spirochaetota bacterium]
LPEQWRQIAKGADVDLGSTSPLRLPIEVDLFKDPGPVKFAREAFALSQEEMTAEAIARRLGTTKWTIHSAIKLGKMMDERGLTSAYAELTGPPARASRWGHRDGTNREGTAPAPIATSQDAA